jgi:hypothetical protein
MKITNAVGANTKGTKIAYLAITPGTLVSYQKLSFWIKGSQGIAPGNTKICLCSDTLGEAIVDSFLIPLNTSSLWIPQLITKNGGGNLGASIASIALYSDTVPGWNSNYSLFLDDIIACTSTGLNLQSLISKNTLDQSTLASTGYGNEGWYAIQSINGTTVLLDSRPQELGNAGRGYSGVTETVNTFIRETIKTTLATAQSTSVQAIQDSGDPTLGNISFLGGYNTGFTNQQDGETFFDGLNGNGFGIDWETLSYVTVGYLAIYRYYNGLVLVTCTNLILTFLSNMSNNTYCGINSTECSNSTITTLLNANNNQHGLYLTDVADKNNTVTNLVNANNNLAYGIYIVGSLNTLVNVSNAKNNATCGINMQGFNNTIGSLTTANNGSAFLYTNLNYVGKWTDGEAVGALGATSFANNKLYVTKYGATYAKIFTDSGYIISQASTLTHGSGTEWLMATQTNTNRQSNYPLTLTIAKIAVNSGSLVTVTCWFKKGHNTNIAAALVCRSGQLNGVAPANVICPSDTNENQLTMTFTPTETGVLEIEAWAWYVAGHSTVIVDAMTVTQASLPTPTNLKTMNYAYQGQPFVNIPAKDSINLKTMNIAYQGQPFVRNQNYAPATKTVLGIPMINVKTINGIPVTNINTFRGVYLSNQRATYQGMGPSQSSQTTMYDATAKYLADNFTANITCSITKISVYLSPSAGTPLTSTLHCYIAPNVANQPGSLTEATTILSSTLTAGFNYYDFTFNFYTVEQNSVNWVVLKIDSVDTGNYLAWGEDTSLTGTCLKSADGITWNSDDVYQGTFRVYYNYEVAI